jgi:flagellar biosynthesis anti-sigma factor FlgM
VGSPGYSAWRRARAAYPWQAMVPFELQYTMGSASVTSGTWPYPVGKRYSFYLDGSGLLQSEKCAGMVDNPVGGQLPSNMKVNDPNLASLASTGASKAQETAPSAPSTRLSNTQASVPSSSDDVHLSELVRSLRSLAADSPERQARIEQLARSYASGTYEVDPQATASKIIDDSLKG